VSSHPDAASGGLASAIYLRSGSLRCSKFAHHQALAPLAFACFVAGGVFYITGAVFTPYAVPIRIQQCSVITRSPRAGRHRLRFALRRCSGHSALLAALRFCSNRQMARVLRR